MIAKKFLSLLLLFSVSFQVSYAAYPPYGHDHYRRSSGEFENVAAAVVSVGCLAAIGYGVYKLCDWLFTPTNERLLKDGIDAISHAHRQHDATIFFVESHFSCIPDQIRDQKKLVQGINEPLLYEYAISHKRNTSIDSILSGISGSIAVLQSHHKALAERVRKLKNSNVHPGALEIWDAVAKMQALDQEIVGLLCKLEFIHDYFAHHKNYFSLFDIEARLMREYEFELSAAYSNLANSIYMKEAVKASIMRNPHARSGYPYLHYGDRVQSDCKMLGGAITMLSYNYANRIEAAQALLNILHAIQSIVLSEDAYHREVRDHKKEQLEKQRIEAERAQAAALEHQANEMRRQNSLRAEQNRLQAERNAIMATQAVVSAFNPPQQPQVHVYV